MYIFVYFVPLLINSPSFFTFHVSLSYYFPLAYKFSIKVFISSWKKIIRNFLNYTFFFKRNRKQSFVRISSLFSLLTNKRKQAPSLINIFVLSIHIFTICWYWNSIDWNLLKKLISSKYLLVRFEISTAIAKCETRVMNRCLDCWRYNPVLSIPSQEVERRPWRDCRPPLNFPKAIHKIAWLFSFRR